MSRWELCGYSLCSQLLDAHFFDQMFRAEYFTGDPECIANVNSDGSTVALVPGEIIDGRFKSAIEIDADQFPLRIQDGTT